MQLHKTLPVSERVNPWLIRMFNQLKFQLNRQTDKTYSDFYREQIVDFKIVLFEPRYFYNIIGSKLTR